MKKEKFLSLLLVVIIGTLVVVGSVSAATTISTNIATGGSLTVSGTATSTFAGPVVIGTTSSYKGVQVLGDLIVSSSTNMNINNPDYTGLFSGTLSFGTYNTVINGRLNGADGGSGNLVIAASISAETSGSNFNIAIGGGYGTNITGSSNDSLAIGHNATIVNGNGSSAIGYGATINGLANTMALGDSSTKVWIPGNIGIGTTTPIAKFQVASGSNATTTAEFGSTGQNKGSCLKLYRTDGSAVYAYVGAGTTVFTLSTTACASITNF